MTAVLHFDFQESAKVLQNNPISLVQSAFLELTESIPFRFISLETRNVKLQHCLILKARNGCFLAWQLISMGIHQERLISDCSYIAFRSFERHF